MEEVTQESAVEEYVHHNLKVKVLSSVKGKHREHCLCFQNCAYFKPEDRTKNCRIANAVFKNCVTFGLVTPVYECPKYRPFIGRPEPVEGTVEPADLNGDPVIVDESAPEPGMDLEPENVPVTEGGDMTEDIDPETT